MPSAVVLFGDGFEEIETLAVIDILRRADIEVKTVGVGSNLLRGAHNVKVYSETRLIDFEDKKFDILIIPGGPGYRELMENQTVLNLVRDSFRAGKIIAAICGAPLILEKAGVLKDKKATIYPGMEKFLSKPRSQKVVVDENIITSQGPGTAI